MKFLMISSYLPSVLNFRGKLLEAIHAQGLEIHVLAPDLQD
ncbi:MAG: glycosyltransferase family 1 protein, partial [Acinetobacter sp.]